MRLILSFFSILTGVFLIEAQVDSSQLNKPLSVQPAGIESVSNADSQAVGTPDQPKGNFSIDWSTIPEDQKINLILSNKGVQISTKKDEDADTGFVIEWENDDSPDEREYTQRNNLFTNTLRGMKNLKFDQKFKMFNIGIGYRFSFLAAPKFLELMNTYSVDLTLQNQHIISFMYGHGLGISDHATKVRFGYEFQHLVGSGYFGAGFEIGTLQIENEQRTYSSPYSTSYYTTTVVKRKAVLNPKLTMGLRTQHFRFGLEEKINFAPKFIHEVGLVINCFFFKNGNSE